VHNLRANPRIELRDETVVRPILLTSAIVKQLVPNQAVVAASD
jgi:hypothetical protein